VTKNEAIKQTMQETKARREDMACRVYSVKIVKRKKSKEKEEHLNRLFLEGKWLWNHTLAQEDVFSADRSPKSVVVKTPDGEENRLLSALGSQMKQDIVDSIGFAIKGLSTKKENGEKIGRVGFRKYCNMIPLRQYGTTYRIDFEKSTVSIQRLKKPIKVRGLDQVPEAAEIANARLVRKPDGLYFHITTYSKPEERIPTGRVGACDFGIEKNFTFDNGDIADISVPESVKLKRGQRKMNRPYAKNGKTKNHEKRAAQIRRDYQNMENRKNDDANKFVHRILTEYDVFAMQDEMISCWHHGLFGRSVQHSAMGRVKAKLKDSPRTIVVERSFPSTQRCPICGKDTPHPLSKRDYDCSYCGYHHESRDVKSASMILMEALKQNVCTGRTTKGPAQAAASVDIVGENQTLPQAATGQRWLIPSLEKQEAKVFWLW
jgi:putative transposase